MAVEAGETFGPLTSGARVMVNPSVVLSDCEGAVLTTTVDRDPAVVGGASTLPTSADASAPPVAAVGAGTGSEAKDDVP